MRTWCSRRAARNLSTSPQGHTAMLRCAFRAAIAQFNLHEKLAAAEVLRLMADVDEGQQDDTVEAGADFRVNPADTILEQIVLPENSADAGVARQGNPAEAGFELIELGDLTPVPTVLASSESEASDADLVLPESSPQFVDLSPRAHRHAEVRLSGSDSTVQPPRKAGSSRGPEAHGRRR